MGSKVYFADFQLYKLIFFGYMSILQGLPPIGKNNLLFRFVYVLKTILLNY
jgi:hypothetical protein